MSPLVILSLLLQGAALLVIFNVVRERRLSYFGVLFVVVAVLNHGVGEILQALFPGRDLYRTYVPQPFVDKVVPYLGAAVLVFAISYAWTLGTRHPVVPTVVNDWWPSWRILLAVSLPLWVVAVGAVSFTATDLQYWGGGLAGQYLLIASAVTVFLYIRQSRSPHVITALLLQSAALALLGERTEVISAAVMVAWGASLVGSRIGRKNAMALLTILVVVGLAITGARAVLGRTYITEATPIQRLQGLSTGAVATTSSTGLSALVDDYAYRLDGNAWPAFVLAEQPSRGVAPLTGLNYDVQLVVPSFLHPQKTDSPVYQRDEEAYFDEFYGIPAAGLSYIPGPDWLPTLFGAALGYGGPLGMILFAALLGFLLARLDLSLHRRITFGRVVLGMGVVWSIMLYERGFDSILLTMRGALLLWLVVKAGAFVKTTLEEPRVSERSGASRGPQRAP